MVPDCISPLQTQTHSDSYRHPDSRPPTLTQDSPGCPFTHPNSNSRHTCQSLSDFGSECSEGGPGGQGSRPPIKCPSSMRAWSPAHSFTRHTPGGSTATPHKKSHCHCHSLNIHSPRSSTPTGSLSPPPTPPLFSQLSTALPPPRSFPAPAAFGFPARPPPAPPLPRPRPASRRAPLPSGGPGQCPAAARCMRPVRVMKVFITRRIPPEGWAALTRAAE